jgi:arylsulfatase A-like enzyme
MRTIPGTTRPTPSPGCPSTRPCSLRCSSKAATSPAPSASGTWARIHNSTPTAGGSTSSSDSSAGGHNYFPGKPAGGPEYNIPIEYNGKDTGETGYVTTALGREAAAFVERHHASPWFLYLAFNAPHTPQMAPEETLAKFASIQDPKRKLHAAMVSAMDDAVGAVLAKLHQRRLEEKTVIFFLSDNGGPISVNASLNTPYRGAKGQVLEGGIRVPFVVRWKDRLPANMNYDPPVISLDIFATAVALAGVSLPAGSPIDGVNLMPHLGGLNTLPPPHNVLHWRTGGGERWAIRQGNHKLLMQDGVEELYDLIADPGESTDLRASRPEIASRLRAAHQAWNAQLVPPLFQSPAGGQRAKQKKAAGK